MLSCNTAIASCHAGLLLVTPHRTAIFNGFCPLGSFGGTGTRDRDWAARWLDTMVQVVRP